jgi:hypothetical protein
MLGVLKGLKMKTDKARYELGMKIDFSLQKDCSTIIDNKGNEVCVVYKEQDAKSIVDALNNTAVEQLEQKVKELERKNKLYLEMLEQERETAKKCYWDLESKIAAQEREIVQLKQIISKEPVYKSTEEYFATISEELTKESK